MGCLKVHVIFRERDTNYRALLRKFTCKTRHPMGLRHPVRAGLNVKIGNCEPKQIGPFCQNCIAKVARQLQIFVCVMFLIHMCAMHVRDRSHSQVWHGGKRGVFWHVIATKYMYVWYFLIHMCDMAHSYAWHDLFICVTWLIHRREMTHSYV